MTDRQLQFTFNREKAIEVILYIAANLSDPTYHSILKVLYAADRLSLVRYGRFVCGDEYYALEFGPVASNTYSIMSEPEQRPEDAIKVINRYEVKPQRKPNMDWLSDTDRECLDEAIERVGTKNFNQRTADSHDEAYLKAWEKRGLANNAQMTIEDIAEDLDDSGRLVDFLRTRYAD